MNKSLLAAVLLSVAASSIPVRAADVTIPLIVKDTTSNYWKIVLAGGRKAGKDLGVKVPELGAQSDADVDGQIAILKNAVAGKPAAIVIAPAQFAALGKPIDEAAKSVKIIGIDSEADSKAFTSFLATDNVKAGRAAADALADGIKAKTGKVEGDVALITSLPGVASLDRRAQGFREELKTYPGLKLTQDKVADGHATAGLNIMTDLLTADPNLVGVFASDLIMTKGAGQAVAENKAGGKVTLVGFDSDDKVVKLLTAGSIHAVIVQNPFRMGYDGVKTAVAVSKGEKVPARIDTGFTVITKADMNTPRNQELLDPKLN